jgi:hypothetical protein
MIEVQGVGLYRLLPFREVTMQRSRKLGDRWERIRVMNEEASPLG